VQAYDPVSQLHLLRFEDGELETVDLSVEQWRPAHMHSISMHTPAMTNAATTAAQWQSATATDADGDTGPSDESTWWAAAQQSVSERPLRVVLDSLTGRFRVLLASEVLQAEAAMLQQQQQQLEQQRQRLEHQQHQFHHQQHSGAQQQQWEGAGAEVAVKAEWWQGQQGGGLMLSSSLNNIGSSSGS
jgi:hypothetical protein